MDIVWFHVVSFIVVGIFTKENRAFAFTAAYLTFVDQTLTSLFNIPDTNYFLVKCFVDLVWLFFAYALLVKNSRLLVVGAVSLSAVVNIYCHADQTVHFLYTYWETIQLVIFESIIAILLYYDKHFRSLEEHLCAKIYKTCERFKRPYNFSLKGHGALF